MIEVLVNASGEPVGLVCSIGISEKVRRQTLERAWRNYQGPRTPLPDILKRGEP